MGFINPAPPPFDVQEWKKKPHLERVKPLAQEWGINGFGTPYAIYVLYLVKLVLFSLGAAYVIGHSTPGLGGLGDFGDWWTEPIVWQKFVVWMVLWEIVGLGSSSMALSFRFLPPIGAILSWVRPGTIRLPPWPDKVPLTAGSRRTVVDVALYLGVVGVGVWLLLSDGTGTMTSFSGEPADVGRLSMTGIAIMLGCWALLGLRDKVSYLCGRPELYGLLLVAFLFPTENLIVVSQVVLVCIWFGAASSKLNRHFPSVVAVMVSNTPWNRSKTIKKQLYQGWPEDMRPSPKAAAFAHLGTVMEYSLPAALLVTQGGTLGAIAVVGMVIFHIHITSTFPLAVPLEWNLFMIYGALFLFGTYGDVPLDTFSSAPLLLIVAVSGIAIPILGNMRPDLISFLPSIRYYAGNWATSQWLFRNDTHAEETLDSTVVKSSPVVFKQLERLYDADSADIFLHKALAFRAMHPHGRAINGLLPHAAVGGEVEDYTIREGEFLCGAITGWNFGDGHFHGKQLLDAVQEQCHFKEGDLRIITLESQPIQVQRQQYKIWDAATGLVEEGYVEVADMISRQPWLDLNYEFPVHVTGGGVEAVPAPPPSGPLVSPA